MLKLCFDEEVGAEKVEIFRKTVTRLRYPPSVLSTFSFKTDKKQPAKCVRLQLPPNEHQPVDPRILKARLNHPGIKRESGIRNNIKGSMKRARNRNGLSSPKPGRKRNLSSDGSLENVTDGHVSKLIARS
jgi:hypothetical protein